MVPVKRRKRYPLLKGHDLSGVVRDPASVGPRGSSAQPGKGSLMTYDMIATVDAEWFSRNAPKVFDAAAAQAGVEFHRGLEEFIGMLDEIGVPNLEKRERCSVVFSMADTSWSVTSGWVITTCPSRLRSCRPIMISLSTICYWILRKWTIWPTRPIPSTVRICYRP